VGQRRTSVGDVGVDPAFWRGRRVLITGNTGFKGSWLTLWLLEMGAEVRGLAPGPPTDPSLYELAGLQAHVPQAAIDIRDADAVVTAVRDAAPEVVIHMAAQPFVRRSFREPRETYEVNVMGTINLFEAVRASGRDARVVLNVTSDKCYENREWEWGYREDDAMGGFDPYSNSKGCSELVTSAYRSSFFSDPDGPRLASGRAGNVIGGGDWGEDRLIPDMMRAALAGEPVEIRRPDAIRPWQHVLNPLSGYLRLAERLWEDPAFAAGFNFGPADEDAQPVQRIVDEIAALWPDPIDWRIDRGPHPHEATWLKLDSSRARAWLGWSPVWNLDDSLRSIVAWYRALREGASMGDITTEQIRAFVAAGD
jgi:CDP-glucose 4,6-dehydratase